MADKSTLIVPDAIIECNLHDTNNEFAIKLYTAEWKELFHADYVISKYYPTAGSKSSSAILPALPPGEHDVFLAFRSSGGYHCHFHLKMDGREETFELYSKNTYNTTPQPNGFNLLDDPIFKAVAVK